MHHSAPVKQCPFQQDWCHDPHGGMLYTLLSWQHSMAVNAGQNFQLQNQCDRFLKRPFVARAVVMIWKTTSLPSHMMYSMHVYCLVRGAGYLLLLPAQGIRCRHGLHSVQFMPGYIAGDGMNRVDRIEVTGVMHSLIPERTSRCTNSFVASLLMAAFSHRPSGTCHRRRLRCSSASSGC